MKREKIYYFQKYITMKIKNFLMMDKKEEDAILCICVCKHEVLSNTLAIQTQVSAWHIDFGTMHRKFVEPKYGKFSRRKRKKEHHLTDILITQQKGTYICQKIQTLHATSVEWIHMYTHWHVWYVLSLNLGRNGPQSKEMGHVTKKSGFHSRDT